MCKGRACKAWWGEVWGEDRGKGRTMAREMRVRCARCGEPFADSEITLVDHRPLCDKCVEADRIDAMELRADEEAWWGGAGGEDTTKGEDDEQQVSRKVSLLRKAGRQGRGRSREGGASVAGMVSTLL